jgi:hypothetical protein
MSRCFRLHRHVVCTVAAFFFCAGIAVPAWAQFETRATRTLPGESFSVAAGDFNGDGKLDIAIMDGQLSVLLGNGDGTFQAPVNYPCVQGLWIATADFNQDGIPDLVVPTYSNTVGVLLGNGDGTFRPPLSSNLTDPASFIAVGDFNNDHKIDIVVIDGAYISVLLGNGDGTFQAPNDNDSFVGAHELAVGDFNNDHRLDTAVVGYFGSSANIGVLLGNGDGTLQPSLTYSLVYTPDSVAAADFNGDGNLDVAIGGYLFNEVTVLLGNGDGSFNAGMSYPGGGYQVIVGDFNGDGKLDFVAEPPVLGVAEWLGNGDGTFQQAETYASIGPPKAKGDLNGDHRPDLLLLDNEPPTITSMLNTGALKFSPSSPLTFGVQLINTTSRPKTLKLTNTGPSGISFESIKTSGPFESTNTCGNSVAAGASCTISATFTPSRYGLQRGGVTIVDSASSKPQFVGLTGVATIVKLSPSSLKFGSQKVGTQSKPQVVTVTNEGSTGLNFDGPTFGGKDPHDFFYSTQCGSVPPGGDCKVSITFAPTRTGTRSAALYVEPQDTVKPPPVSLSGTGD